MDKDGNDLDGDCSRPQKHAKSPELAREFLLDVATVIFKEQQSMCNVAKTNPRTSGSKFAERLHGSNRMSERDDFHSCSCYQHNDYKTKIESHRSAQTGRDGKVVCKSESSSDVLKPYNRGIKYTQVDHTREGMGRPKLNMLQGAILIQEIHINGSSSNPPVPEISSASDKDDASQHSERREQSRSLQNSFHEHQDLGMESKQSAECGQHFKSKVMDNGGNSEPGSFSMKLAQEYNNGMPNVSNMNPQPHGVLPPLHSQSIHYPLFQPASIGYYHQTDPVSWPAV
ncbi:hypothetical protein POM88_013452 [Heracleum sosnowskyi]|uniref:Uncharacterized protein n=1 Tax=Heracleum sosnowskyi TaxID=360622 RepID=A0AAD8N3C2_9APIA|nr:hypothetical protein POM88_013452 [Heracleum sosnowskyi]